LDWSNTNNIAVALNKDMYVWSAESGEIQEVFSFESNNPEEDENETAYITSCAWIQNGTDILACGTSKNDVELWDINEGRKLRKMSSHISRVSSLSWNGFILSSGSRSGLIHHHDVRIAQHHVATLKLHEQEVCGLKWSPDGRHLASGGNDNIVTIWDANTSLSSHNVQPLHVIRDHKAAVKALAWCPWQNNILASGGGTADRHIKIWNASSGTLMQSHDAKSQISCILWSKQYRELITSHGFQLNQLSIWKYPEMTRVCDLKGHTDRVLMMSMSPDEQTVASISADETLRLWKCFPTKQTKSHKSSESLGSLKSSASHNSLARCIR
jgi:cell division cycle protein 20 (cofactor of APC complex)